MFSDWLRNAAAKAFSAIPSEPIWRWADREVVFQKQHSAEARFRSSKTPWTRWVMDIARNPWRMRKGRRTRIRRVRIKKCTQSGFTESLLNVIRWCAKFAPRNFIYSINSKDEAVNIRERLVDSLVRLGEEIFLGDPDELTKYTIRLREMIGWFLGSYSEGAFANKFAPLVIADEYDDHAIFSGNATTLDLLDERLKTAEDGLSFALGKPQAKGGPIDKEHGKGDKWEWMVPCPHCETHQLLDWTRVRFGHCKDLFGKWDRERVLAETHYECVCGCKIEETHKAWMEERGHWWLTDFGDPETVALHISDLHSMHAGSTLGHLALEFIDATDLAKRGDFSKLRIFNNGRLGEGFEERTEKISVTDVMACRAAYRRGIIPHPGLIVLAGMDVGLFVNTVWGIYAVHPQTTEAWIIDWGTAREPLDLLDLMRTKTWLCHHTGEKQGIAHAFIDCRYLREKVFATAQQIPGRIWPTLGLKAGVSARSIGFTPVPQAPRGFGVITYIDADAKLELYIDRIKRRRHPGLHFPEDADEPLMHQFANEHLVVDPITGRARWPEKAAGPNHWADTAKIVITGYDYLIDGPRTRASGLLEPAASTDLADIVTAQPV